MKMWVCAKGTGLDGHAADVVLRSNTCLYTSVDDSSTVTVSLIISPLVVLDPHSFCHVFPEIEQMIVLRNQTWMFRNRKSYRL